LGVVTNSHRPTKNSLLVSLREDVAVSLIISPLLRCSKTNTGKKSYCKLFGLCHEYLIRFTCFERESSYFIKAALQSQTKDIQKFILCLVN